jgi:hypothetical protein
MQFCLDRAPTREERARAELSPRWLVATYEPGAQYAEWPQAFASEQDAIDAAEAWVGELVEQQINGVWKKEIVEMREYSVFLHPEDAHIGALRAAIERWDDLVWEREVAHR